MLCAVHPLVKFHSAKSIYPFDCCYTAAAKDAVIRVFVPPGQASKSSDNHTTSDRTCPFDERQAVMRVELCPFLPDDENHSAPMMLTFPTDTSTPQAAVPIFLIHSLAQPFCDQPGCLCQQQRQQIAALLVRIASGALTFRQEGGQTSGQ